MAACFNGIFIVILGMSGVGLCGVVLFFFSSDGSGSGDGGVGVGFSRSLRLRILQRALGRGSNFQGCRTTTGWLMLVVLAI